MQDEFSFQDFFSDSHFCYFCYSNKQTTNQIIQQIDSGKSYFPLKTSATFCYGIAFNIMILSLNCTFPLSVSAHTELFLLW